MRARRSRHTVLEARQDPVAPGGSADAGEAESSCFAGSDGVPRRAPERVSRRGPQAITFAYPAEELLAQVLGYVNKISAEQLKRMRRKISPCWATGSGSPASRRRSTRCCARSGTRRAPRRLAGPPEERVDADAGAEPGGNVRLTIDISLEGRQRADPAWHRARLQTDAWAANGGDRRDRSQQRRRARDGVVPDVQAQRLHEGGREATEAPARRRHLRAGRTPPSTARRPRSIRRARPSSRSALAARSTSSRSVLSAGARWPTSKA